MTRALHCAGIISRHFVRIVIIKSIIEKVRKSVIALTMRGIWYTPPVKNLDFGDMTPRGDYHFPPQRSHTSRVV